MSDKRTKAELLAEIGRLGDDAAEYKDTIAKLKGESQRFERDSIREATYSRNLDARLNDAKRAIEQHLKVEHKCETASNDEYFRGQWIAEEVTEDVRFLRYLHAALNSDTPF